MPRGALAGVRCFSVGRAGGVGSAAVFVGSVSGSGSAAGAGAGAARGTILTLGGRCGFRFQFCVTFVGRRFIGLGAGCLQAAKVADHVVDRAGEARYVGQVFEGISPHLYLGQNLFALGNYDSELVVLFFSWLLSFLLCRCNFLFGAAAPLIGCFSARLHLKGL